MSNIDFIGLGMMGRPVAGHLIAGGHKLFVHDHKSAPQELIDKGAVDSADGREVVQRSEVIITMVAESQHVEAALFDPGGVAEGLTARKIVVDMSSISPIATKDFVRRINAL